MIRAVAVALALAAAVGCSVAAAAPPPTQAVYDGRGRLVDTPFAPTKRQPRLDEKRATAILFRAPKVARWLDRYPPKPQTEAEFDADNGTWTVKAWSGKAGQIVLGTVVDLTGGVTETWTGPQVAWKMARGSDGAFGGKTLNEPWVWLILCGAFLLGLADLRRPLSLRNLDLLALLSFSVSLWYFNRGQIFTSVPLAYPPLLYLTARAAWIGLRGRPPRAAAPVWPVWVLVAATVFLAGFRIGLNFEAPTSVIDVGYAGVIGGHRILNGEAPYGNMPVQGNLKACGPADSEGETRERIQTNGRCEASNDRGDTYGPVAYLAYVPAVAVFGWSGKWDSLPAAHATSILFDLLCIGLSALLGLRLGGARLAATLAFAWTAFPFTLYVLNSDTNDAIMPALLLGGLLVASSPARRGAFAALAGLTKFGALIVVPLWLGHPNGIRSPGRGRFVAGFVAASLAAFAMLLLEPSVPHAARVFAERTLSFQIGRESPFSIWDWGQYHARGIPALHSIQLVLEGLLIAAAVLLAFVPRGRSTLQLAALTGALLGGFQLVLTHWFYLYLPWFFPFVALAVLAPRPPEPEEAPDALAVPG